MSETINEIDKIFKALDEEKEQEREQLEANLERLKKQRTDWYLLEIYPENSYKRITLDKQRKIFSYLHSLDRIHVLSVSKLVSLEYNISLGFSIKLSIRDWPKFQISEMLKRHFPTLRTATIEIYPLLKPITTRRN